MAKMGVLILCPLLAIVFAGWIDPGSALKPPQNVIKDLLNLNLSFYWEPPDDASNVTTYTVKFQEKKTFWRSIPHCTNITKTECPSITSFLIAEYGTDVRNILLITKSFFNVTRREQQPSSVANLPSASVTVEVFPYFDATISAPDIEILELTSDSIDVALLAPETVFYDGETQQFFRMDDNKLGGFSKVNFNYTLWNISGDGQDSNKVYEASLDDNSKVVSLSELTPYTLYALAVSASIGGKKFSKDNSTLIFRTKEAAPSRSPTLLVPFEELDCKKLNSRDVRIEWKAPAKEYWNGRSIHYEVRLHRVKDGDEYVTSIAVMNASSTSTTVHDLSRLDTYDIVVFANTSGGGIPSSRRSLPGAYQNAGFKPEDLHRMSSSHPVEIIEWKPPSGYEKCIFEYRVIVESDGRTVRTTDVKNATSLDLSDLEPGTYVAEVAVITKGRNYTLDYGLPASLPLNVVQPIANTHEIFLPVTVVLFAFVLLVLVVICGHVVKSLRSNMSFSSLDTFLLKAFSQRCSPVRHCDVEKEMFDTPKNYLKLQSQEAVASETSLSTDDESTEFIVNDATDNAAESRVPHDDNLNVGSNQPLRPPHIIPSDTDDDTDDDPDAEHEALLQQHIESSRSAGGETKPDPTSSRSADTVPSSGHDDKPSKHPDRLKQPQHESVEKSLPLIKISRQTSFESPPSPSSPNGIGLGYTVLANML